ncbi:MAG TPA: TatD family hydrolase [Terriglobales bacterium]|nr:TatD family hydrolase [Terriglobales bacterium]
MLIDSHCHPDDEAFAGEREAVLERARAAGVEGLVAIHAPQFARDHQGMPGLRVWATIGVHPHEAGQATAATWEELQAWSGAPEVIGVGEVGLDYHYDHAPRGLQQAVFQRQLELAAGWGLPVAVHCREAFADCLALIAAHNPPGRGVLHCFAGTRAEAEAALQLGWYLSFSGLLTFPKLEGLRQVAAWAPAERLLVETDAPYLAPVPHRGRRNEPAWVGETAAALARARGVAAEALAAQVRANFFRLFPRALAG